MAQAREHSAVRRGLSGRHMQARLCFVTLGVADVTRATAFYARLGFARAAASSNAHVSFMQAGGVMYVDKP